MGVGYVEVEFAFICDYAEQDRKLHAVGIGWDTIFAQQVPTRHPQMTFAAKLIGSVAEAGSKDFSLRLIDADGEDVIPPITGQFPFEVKPGQLEAAANIVLNMGGVEFKKYGAHAMHLVVQGLQMKVVRFAVAPPPQTA